MQRSPCIPVMGRQTRNTAKSYNLPGFDCGLKELLLQQFRYLSESFLAVHSWQLRVYQQRDACNIPLNC